VAVLPALGKFGGISRFGAGHLADPLGGWLAALVISMVVCVIGVSNLWMNSSIHRFTDFAEENARGRPQMQRLIAVSMDSIVAPEPAASDTVPGDAAPVIDEEISRLPTRYREPIVLCYPSGGRHFRCWRSL
jgi:hypothetical protein